MDPFILSLSFIAFLIYGSVCGIAIIFTFLPETYLRIEEKLRLDVLSSRILTPLEINIDWFDNWLMKHHRFIGPILVLLSMIDLKLFLNIINKL